MVISFLLIPLSRIALKGIPLVAEHKRCRGSDTDSRRAQSDRADVHESYPGTFHRIDA
jgi:hypothetical protein